MRNSLLSTFPTTLLCFLGSRPSGAAPFARAAAASFLKQQQRKICYTCAIRRPIELVLGSNINNNHLLHNSNVIHRKEARGTRNMSSSSSSGDNKNDEVANAVDAARAASDDLLMPQPRTIFDKLVSGEIPCTKVYEDDVALAFRDVNPCAPTHVLVIPKHSYGGSLTQLSKAAESQKDVLGHLLFVAGQVGKQECPNGFRLVINDGADGAQSVYHLHIHVLGGRQMLWPPG